jgi:hypothetical protein
MFNKITPPQWGQLTTINARFFRVWLMLQITINAFHLWRRAWELLPVPIKFPIIAGIATHASLLILPFHPLSIPGSIVIGLFVATLYHTIEELTTRKERGRPRNTQNNPIRY